MTSQPPPGAPGTEPETEPEIGRDLGRDAAPMPEAEASALIWDAVARVDNGDHRGAALLMRMLHPADQADVFAALDHPERRRLMEQVDAETLRGVLQFFTPEELDAIAPEVPPTRLAEALGETGASRAADVLHAIPEPAQESVLGQLQHAELVAPLLELEDDTAGGIMSPEIITLRPQTRCGEAIERIREYRREPGPPPAVRQQVYVVDADERLLGTVQLYELIAAPADTPLRELMVDPGPVIEIGADQEEALQVLLRYGLHTLPVVDEQGRVAGVMTSDDLLPIAQQEATEDMYRLVGLTDSGSLTASVRGAVRRRLPWLLINLATAFAAAGVVAAFDGTLERVVALAIFLPIIAGQGGNAGVQVTTLAVRAMALGEFDRHLRRTVLPREAAIGVITGLVLGLVVGVIAGLWQGNWWFGLVVGLAMLGAMIAAGLFGLMIPYALRRAGADPALAAAIIVTTFTDVLGFLIFLGIAALLIDRLG